MKNIIFDIKIYKYKKRIIFDKTFKKKFDNAMASQEQNLQEKILNWIECDAWAQAGYSPNESHPKREEV